MRFILLFFLTFSCAFGEEIFLQPGTPLFRTSELSPKPDGIVPEPGVYLEATGKSVVKHYEKNALAYRLEMKEVRLNPQTTAWTLNGLGTELRDGRFLRYFPIRDAGRMAFGAILVLGAALCARGFFVKRNLWYPAIAILLLQWGIMLYITGCVPALYSHPFDETSYFAAAYDIAHGVFNARQWSYTIGLPLLYVPFIWLTGAKEFYDIEIPYTLFNTYLLGPLCLVLLYFILRKLTRSEAKAFGGVVLYQLMSVFYQYQDQWMPDMADWAHNIYKSFFTFPTLDFSYNLYTKYTILHCNALSDTLSTLTVFGCIALLLHAKNGWKTLAGLSVLFGYACVVRLNNIFFAPLLAFLLICNCRERLHDWKSALRFLGTGAACWFAVVALQLIVNRIQFGDFLRFPYCLHDEEVYKGFMWKIVPHGLRFILSTLYAYFALGLAGLCLMRERRMRTVFGLWILPLFFFFAGYPQIGNNVARFLLSVVMVLPACIFCTESFDNASRKERIAAMAAVLLPLVTAAPSNYLFPRLLQWDLQQYAHGFLTANLLTVLSALISIALAVIFLRKKREEFLFVMVFLALFLPGSWHLLAAVAAGLFLRAVYDACAELPPVFTGTKAAE